ncbi:hypothetical protein M501DRAFT_1059101 [Patellaria atrata CBS 101060]|uniref:Uncharacterized protein n=1 Tax=Patellaria atrata CBS 101060 TaxID=1346257 RepID=A0A9P4S7S7_9PEZI|nr:hypothetical protein M501DRAFT_1059101 [Patellaria atrata CBS 101060]
MSRDSPYPPQQPTGDSLPFLVGPQFTDHPHCENLYETLSYYSSQIDHLVKHFSSIEQEANIRASQNPIAMHFAPPLMSPENQQQQATPNISVTPHFYQHLSQIQSRAHPPQHPQQVMGNMGLPLTPRSLHLDSQHHKVKQMTGGGPQLPPQQQPHHHHVHSHSRPQYGPPPPAQHPFQPQFQWKGPDPYHLTQNSEITVIRTSELMSLRSQLKMGQGNLAGATQTITTLNADNKTLQSLNKELTTDVKTLKDDIKALTKQLTTHLLSENRKDARIQELEGQHTRHLLSGSPKDSRILELEDQQEILRARIGDLEIEKKDLIGQLLERGQEIAGEEGMGLWKAWLKRNATPDEELEDEFEDGTLVDNEEEFEFAQGGGVRIDFDDFE